MRVFREPCYFAEAVYLLYFFVNQISYEEEYSRISRNYYKRVKEDDEDEARILRRVRELNRVLSVVTAGLDRGDARLRYYFKAMQLPSFKNSCCLAQIMLVTVPLDCSDVEEFAGRLEREYAHMQEIGFKINDLNAMGLVMDGVRAAPAGADGADPAGGGEAEKGDDGAQCHERGGSGCLVPVFPDPHAG